MALLKRLAAAADRHIVRMATPVDYTIRDRVTKETIAVIHNDLPAAQRAMLQLAAMSPNGIELVDEKTEFKYGHADFVAMPIG